MAKSFLANLIPSRANANPKSKQADGSSKSKRNKPGSLATKPKPKSKLSHTASKKMTRWSTFDDEKADPPPPPRGSVNADKLHYLDWRLARIQAVRATSEGCGQNWEDGRKTIGRTSFEVVEENDDVSSSHSSSSAKTFARPDAAYQVEKATGTRALEQALLVDNDMVSMPVLAMDANQSDSDESANSDGHCDKQMDAVAELPVAQIQMVKPDRRRKTVSFLLNRSGILLVASLNGRGKPSSMIKSQSTKESIVPKADSINTIHRSKTLSRLLS